MKIIDLEQGSQEWLQWRKTVITATECPIILGSSPWSTPYKCWQRKLGLIEEQKTNDFMERGKRLEPIARDRFIKKMGINMTPVVVESSEYEFLGASLDGISDDRKYILEVKSGGHKLLQSALEGTIPEYYMHQMQHQLLVTGAEKCFYLVTHEDEEKEVILEVFKNPDFEREFLPKARAFWKGIAFFEPPHLMESDYRHMEDDLDWAQYSKMYLETDAALKALSEKKDYLRKKLIELCANENCSGRGIKVIKTIMKGRIAYDEIPQIKDIDLDKYRKSSSTVWKVLTE
jgi:putative phage-type endonuclease